MIAEKTKERVASEIGAKMELAAAIVQRRMVHATNIVQGLSVMSASEAGLIPFVYKAIEAEENDIHAD